MNIELTVDEQVELICIVSAEVYLLRNSLENLKKAECGPSTIESQQNELEKYERLLKKIKQ